MKHLKHLISPSLIYSLTVPLAILVVVASSFGLLAPGIYTGATTNWLTQTVGQDAVNIFLVVPVLLISAIYQSHGSRVALQVWAAANMYLVYTFLIYCFDVRFNQLFVAYCLILGLAAFSVGVFLLKTIRDESPTGISGIFINKVVGYFMIVPSVVFYALWLSDILPAIISGTIPEGVQATGLFTNPVHVIDLAIFLPLVFVIGVFVLRQNPIAINLAPVIILFFVLMDITIAVLTWMLFKRGIDPNYSVAIVMGIHAALSIGVVSVLISKTVYIKPIYL